MCKIRVSGLQALLPKLKVLFETRSCDMYLIHSYTPLQLPKLYSFSPFSDSCRSKIHVKTWGEESYIAILHAIPTTFGNNLLLVHNRKIAIAQNYKKIN